MTKMYRLRAVRSTLRNAALRVMTKGPVFKRVNKSLLVEY